MSTAAALWLAPLGALLAVACATDLRERRIPNALAAVVLALGLVRAGAASAGALPADAPTLGPALLGAAAGLAAWLPFYAAGVLGAGDVKLVAAAGAWLGPPGLVDASVYAALAGGALGLAWYAAGALGRPAPAGGPAPRGGPARGRRLPYALAITAGVLAAAWGRGA